MTKNTLHRYLFDNASVRGELVQLSTAYQELINGQDYPAPIKKILGELMIATSLLTATLKFKGSITIQIQGDGPVSLVVINGTHDHKLRGTARWKEDIPDTNQLSVLLGKGNIVITIEPEQGERYQGIIGIDHDDLQTCLEEYFVRSEQLETRIWLRTGTVSDQAINNETQDVAAGMLLQVIPDGIGEDGDFEHLSALTETVKDQELFELDAEEILHRLYHQEKVRIYPEQEVCFSCTCSRERSANALLTLGMKEVEDMLSETGDINLHCDYCGTDYRFDRIDIDALFKQALPPVDNLH